MKCRLSQFFHKNTLFLLIFTVIFFASSGIAVHAKNLRLVQVLTSKTNQVNTENQPSYIQGKNLLQAADKLFQQGTVISRKEALAKYLQALEIWQQLGARPEAATTLFRIGTIYHLQNEQQKALTYYRQVLVIRRELKNRFEEAIALQSIANSYFRLDDKLTALTYYKQALSLFQAEKKNDFISQIFISIGRIYFSLGESKKALDSYHQALSLQVSQKDLIGQADTLQTIGQAYMQLGEAKKALDALNQALEIQRQTKNSIGEIDTLNLIGLLYTSLGENQKAQAVFNLLLELQKTTPGINISSQVITFMALSSTDSAIGDYEQGLDYLHQARSLLQKSQNSYDEAEVLEQMSFIYNRLGRKQQALDSLTQALILQRANKFSSREAFTLSNMAEIYESLGEYQKALDLYNQAITLQRQLKERQGEANTLSYIARVYKSLGDYQLSLQTYNQALEIFQIVQDRSSIAQTLDHVGSVYQAAANHQEALNYYKQALQLWQELGGHLQEFTTLTGIIRVYESLSDYPQALATAEQSLLLAKKQQDSFMEASALALLGRVYLSKADYSQALDSLNQSVHKFKKLGIKNAEANVIGNIGKAYNLSGNPQQAIRNYRRELNLRQELGDLAGKAETLYNIAIAFRNQGNLNASRTNIETTIKIIEDIRTRVSSQQLRTSYFATVQKYYEFYIDLLMRLHQQQPSKGYDALALQVSEQARARSLLDLLTEANADIRQGVDPKLLAAERALQQELNALEKLRIQSLTDKQNQTPALEKKIAELLEKYQQLQAQIRTASPGYAALTQPQSLSVKQIQSSVLDDNTLLLEYYLGEERSYLWAVTKKTITSYELPKRADIELAARQFRKSITSPIQRANTAKTASVLSQLILAPVAQQLQPQRLVIVSHGALQYVPFAALSLPDSPQPLATRHEIINLPSASTIAILRQQITHRQTPSKMLAVIADPIFSHDDQRIQSEKQQSSQYSQQISQQQLTRSVKEFNITFDRLPFTRQEAEQILKLVSPSIRKQALDFAANRETALNQDLSQYRIIHFATHGILNTVHPELSGLVLSLFDQTGNPQNGFLRLHDIFNLKLSAQLVVLSACQTGLGEQVRGEGLVGLTRGFMYAGSPRVVVSLWNVDDEATSILMKNFYQKMLQDGLKPAAALRAAQIEMSQSQNYSAPYYWAAFTLQGEWQ